MAYSAPRLYLAAGVTTLRTTGSVALYTDLNLKQQTDQGLLPGPHLDVTGPYLEGKSDLFIQMHQLTGPDDARRMVDYWAGEGVTSSKGYMHITRDELAAAVAEAHHLGLKVTAHLCAVTYAEAAKGISVSVLCADPFWAYLRNRWPRDEGLRIDHLLLSPVLAPRLVATGVDRGARGEEGASDHAPTWIELDL